MRFPWTRDRTPATPEQDGTGQALFSESIRTLHASLLNAITARPFSMMFTSVTPAVGKSVIAANLAVSLSGTEIPVLVVDANLANPALQQFFHRDDLPPLSSYLERGSIGPEAFDTHLLDKNLAFIPAGPNVPNPAERLASPAMGNLLEAAKKRFGFVIVDSPTVFSASGVTALASLVDTTLLVALAGTCKEGDLKRGRHLIEMAGGRIAGVVLNRTDAVSGSARS